MSAAYLRAIGSTQAAAAEAAGVSERTLRNWERSSWWVDATAEASSRWLTELTAASRAALMRAVRGNGKLALAVLERVDPRLAPPKQQHVHNIEPSELTDEQLAKIIAGADPDAVVGRRR